MGASSIKFLVKYLERERSEDDDFPLNKLTCLAVVCYVVKKKHGSSKTIELLDLMAEEYLYAEYTRKQEDVDVMENRMPTISHLFVNSFIPEAQIHFSVPELGHLCDKDKKNLTRNDILASFLDFLVQLLHRESNVDTARKQRYFPLQNSLLFLLSVLGDKPFDCSTRHSVLEDQVNDLLTEFKVLANEAGRFIYSCVFSVRPFDDEMFYAERSALLKNLEILNVKIKQLCIKFSKLPIHDVPVSNVVDSFFIIHSLVNDLDNFSAEDLCSMKDQISMFRDELRTSSLVILECTGPRQGDGDMKEPLVQIRDLAYEAEYLINSHVVGNIHAWYLDLRLLSITRKIRFSRKKLQRIKELQPSQVMIRHGEEFSDVTHAKVVDDNHFVELKDNTTGKILSDLVGGYKKSREIISIYGMPGIGKTTIANKLYLSSSASSYFDRRAWCVVSQTYSVRSLLINILIHVAMELKNDEILKKTDEELRLDIHKSLFQRRYLIVLDDVWHSNTWYHLQPYLPDDGNGSRVILTSRIKDASPHGSIFHTLPFFSKDQCLDLLEKKMFPGESCPPELLDIGRRIAKKCSGIPLAVVVTAGILANLKREENAWERVEKQLETFLLDGPSDYRKILELSYEHLPHHLKPCFLYFAAFPEDAEISVIKLAWRWISEGFIPKNEGKTPEQVAEMYLSDLMSRSLVLPGKRRADGGIKTCRIHDLLLDVCVKKASEENFLNSDNELSIYEKHQRSYLLHTSNTDSRPFGLYCRSLIGGLPDRSSCFQTKALLKILDIMPNKFHKFDGTSFDLPIHLRYLGVNHLTNKMVANLGKLEFINIVNSSQITVPSIVLRMKKLRHLIVKKEAIFEDDGYISETTNLRTLLYVCIYRRLDEMIMRDSPHLLKLKCKVGGKIIFPDTSFLEELETLKLVFEVPSLSRGENVSNLKFPSSIKNLCLSNAIIPWKQMSVIGKLPILCVLKLEDHAFVGDEWETLDDEFKELRFLKIEQSNLKHWITCNEHFPRLERLVLYGCKQLVEIPYDLCYSSTLQIIDVEFCSIRACLSAVRIEQEKHNNGDEEFWVNITTGSWTREVEELSEDLEMAASSVQFLVQYLEREESEDDDFPWNKLTCLAVFCYVVKKKHGSSDIIRSLDLMAEEAEEKGRRRKQKDDDVMKNKMQTISHLLVNSFISEAQIHFTVPELDHLSDKDNNNLKKSEILAGFLDFLIQILYREANVDTAREQRYTPLRKSLLFLLAILGDKPFDCSTLHSVLEDQVKDLLTEFEVLANEAGRFIYSCVFSVRPFNAEMFYAERSALLEKLEILNFKIKQHCIKFSELPALDVPVYNIVDSFFIVHSLVDDLDSFPAQDLCSVKDQFSMFHDELRASQALLKFIEVQQDNGAMKEPLVQIRDLAYEAEYLINSHVVGNIHAWYLDLRLPSTTQKLKLARERLQLIKELQPSQVMIRHGGEISNVTHATAVDANHFVELKDNTTRKILSDLVGGYKKSREIISIYGMPGLGKTTIANKLYHSSSASSYFDRRAWCVVSQTYSVRSLLINILIHVARELKNDEILKKSDEELGVDILKSLKRRRYLIVLDDVWHSNTWYDLQPYLPDDGNGSRVILTSRIKDAFPHGSIFYTLPFFSEYQCLDLLEKKMFPRTSFPQELLNIGRGIAKKCSGIPLAVVVTAGILANLKREENAWERVEKQLDTFLLDSPSDYRKILELSYEHLPHHLKPCFLYFAAFPEDAEISVIKLAWRWISEGFIPKNEGKTPEQVAEMYLSDLMNRSLVLPGKRRTEGGTKTCRIHDLLLHFCIKKASEENFLNSDNELSICEKHQRSYLPHISNTDSRPFGLYCRSIIGGLPDRSSCFQTRALLKVLDIMPNKFHKFDCTSFDLPIQLRYLGVNRVTDKMVANLGNLEFINIVNSSQITVPSIVLRMKKLRHLIVKKEGIFEDNDYISETTNLRTLLYVCIYKRLDEMILRDLPHLLKLKCKVGGKIIFPDTSFLEELETLKLVFEVYSRRRGIKLSNLKFPSSIKNLCLSNANIPWKQMSVIGKLPNLCVLQLENDAFVGDEWKTLDGEFEELRFLKIEQSNLKHWITRKEHFPRLERVVLRYCKQLVEIPYDLCDSSTMQRIDVEFCLIRACLSAVRIEQEKHNNGDEEFRVNITMEMKSFG